MIFYILGNLIVRKQVNNIQKDLKLTFISSDSIFSLSQVFISAEYTIVYKMYAYAHSKYAAVICQVILLKLRYKDSNE